MNILILGSGGREHAFAWKIKQSPLCKKLYIAPGNAGTHQLGTNVNLSLSNFTAIGNFALEENIDLIIVGPEVPLVNGIKDYFQNNPSLSSIIVIGPNKKAASLEGSKDFSKAFMQRHNIPTAKAKTFTITQIDEAKDYLKTLTPPFVLKADGLAAGKGVIIVSTIHEAEEALKQLLIEEKFGDASKKVLIEEFLDGIELSVFVLTDGENYKILPIAKDYKKIGENDTGLNTGGMGAVSPVPFATKKFLKKVEEKIILPTLNGLKKEQIIYSGFLFLGLMKVKDEPYVIEYNVRMGDPETQVVLPRIQSDLIELLLATAQKRLNEVSIKIETQHAATVVAVAKGYPENYEKGKVINISNQDHLTFHAGTTFNKNQQLVTNGGRVIACTGMGKSLTDALQDAYSKITQINFEGKNYRQDIGQDILSLDFKPEKV